MGARSAAVIARIANSTNSTSHAQRAQDAQLLADYVSTGTVVFAGAGGVGGDAGAPSDKLRVTLAFAVTLVVRGDAGAQGYTKRDDHDERLQSEGRSRPKDDRSYSTVIR